MEPAKRIVINTLAQHIRSVVNICLSLYSTRLILQALGQSDFGIYSLLAGVVAMLGFITNAMVITTQRQLSFCHGKGDITLVRKMFSNSMFIHIILAVLLVIILIPLKDILFSGFLIIDDSRIDAATTVYFLVILSLIITFLTAPYRALFIARENIVYISVVDVLDGIIKLFAAFWLLSFPHDRLIAYSWMIAGIMALNFLLLSVWALIRFPESMYLPRLRDINRQSMKELTGFAGWTIYSIGCIVGRTQGVAIILNQFFGTLINAAYGIAQQVFGAVQFIAQSVINAISPQLIKAEGAGNREHMLVLAELSSKYAFLLLSIVTIPLLFEMPTVLSLWLGDVPDYAVILCRFILITALCDQITIGLGTANQAIGRIRNYSLTVNTIKLLTLPAFWLTLLLSRSVLWGMWCYLGFEVVCALTRLPFLKLTANLSIRHFLVHVFLKSLPPVLTQVAVCRLLVSMIDSPVRVLITFALSALSGIAAIWLFALEPKERTMAYNIIKRHSHE